MGDIQKSVRESSWSRALEVRIFSMPRYRYLSVPEFGFCFFEGNSGRGTF